MKTAGPLLSDSKYDFYVSLVRYTFFGLSFPMCAVLKEITVRSFLFHTAGVFVSSESVQSLLSRWFSVFP